MSLKSQDILVLLKLFTAGKGWTFRSLAGELFMSTSEIHQALKRAQESDLFDTRRQVPKLRNLEEFLLHGIRYVFPAKRGALVRGFPTSYAAAPLDKFFAEPEQTYPPVWPDATGTVRGYALEPLYRSAPQAAIADPKLYELLVLIDAIRDGRARERSLACEILHERLSSNEQTAATHRAH